MEDDTPAARKRALLVGLKAQEKALQRVERSQRRRENTCFLGTNRRDLLDMKKHVYVYLRCVWPLS